ncbi:MAG: 2'-5' RNA ligase family protein [Bryobacteraceae bacterium]|jgi:2'-5' RNA ligase
MNHIPEAPRWGCFALVSYIPEPLASFLKGLREILPNSDSSEAHITLLPPRRLKLPVETASKQARTILSHFAPFDVELSKVRRFAETKFLYLDLGEGRSVVHELHDLLNKGDLFDSEEFEFRPHLTLGGPVSPGVLDSAQHQAELTWNTEHCAARFTVQEIVCLWSSPDSAQGEWHRLWSQKLSSAPARTSAAAATVTNRTL